MIDANKKKIVKKLFNEMLDIDEEKTLVTKDINSSLEKNPEYQELIEQKKELENKIKDKQEFILNDLTKQKENLTQNFKLIKEDISEKLEIKQKIVSQVYKFFKIKYLKNKDELKEITDSFVDVFEI
jgi:hypothetical protein